MSASHTYDLSQEMVRHRVIALLKGEWQEWHKAHPDRKLELVVRLHEEKRRLRQNGLYWALVTEIADQLPDHMNGEYHTKRVWDEFFKERFLGVESVSFQGRPMHMTKAHKDLNVADFSDYLTQVLAWSAEHEVKMEMKWREDYAEVEKRAA